MKNIFRFLVFALLIQSLSLSAYHDKAWNKAKKKNNRSINASGCSRPKSSTSIEFNNVRALIQTGGDMWWDLIGEARYEVPKGSGKTALFAGAIWIGGTDVNDQLRISAVKFRSGGVDFWTGPLIVDGPDIATVTEDVCSQYDKHFPMERKDVAEFRTYINAVINGDREILENQFEGYQIPDAILNWPAHGDASRGYDYYLAPFYDADGSGHYNPESGGDYPFFDFAEGGKNVECGTSRAERKPRLFGDYTMWWVYNDKGNIHTETNGDAIGMEIRAQYFAFSTADELNNMTFGNYALINRSTYTLYNTYFGVWTDADLGYAFDDFVGCDVKRGLGYLYNGKELDGTGNGKEYGEDPPAIGVDFFEGPYMDPYVDANGDTIDRPSPYMKDANGEETSVLDLSISMDTSYNGMYNGGINGLNFGDNIGGNERWGMRRFIYFNNDASSQGDPVLAQQYYNYLDGLWKDGRPLSFGGTGYISEGGTPTDFMFPGETDPVNWGTKGIDPNYTKDGGWTEENEGNEPYDRRFVQSAGPFTLHPGAVNDITVGMVWARASGGGPFASVRKVQEADDKAQKLFENCFVMIDGPDAPDLKITELDKELVFQIYNVKSVSNNYTDFPEDYAAKDPFIICPIDTDGTSIDCDRFYKFEGYQVFQLKDKSVTTADLDNPEFSRLVFQCDIKNDVSTIVNYVTEPITGKPMPKQMVVGNNKGLQHSFKITQDAFATAEKGLVNHKKYYFMAVAYAFNQFKVYDPEDPKALDGQKTPYLRGRKGSNGSIKTYEVIPHLRAQENGGTILNSSYGEMLDVTMVEGMGTGQNFLDLKQETIDKIMSGAPWRVYEREYKGGYAPIQVSIVDPLNVVNEDYVLRFDSVQISTNSNMRLSGIIDNANWYMYPEKNGNKTLDTTIYIAYNDSMATKYDTVLSIPMAYVIPNVVSKGDTGQIVQVNGDDFKFIDCTLSDLRLLPKDSYYSSVSVLDDNDVLFPELGISVRIKQVGLPGPGPGCSGYDKLPENRFNGFVGSSVEFEDASLNWLTALGDSETEDIFNWIATGNVSSGFYKSKSYGCSPKDRYLDFDNDWDNIVNGLFGVYRSLRYDEIDGGNVLQYQVAYKDLFNKTQGKKFDIYRRTPSIDIVITKDTNLWTRCPVVEMCEYDTVAKMKDGNLVAEDFKYNTPSQFSEGGAIKFHLRKAPSVYRNGKPMNPADAEVISMWGRSYSTDSSMGWFPGYVIDVETGARLNVFFGEDSRWPNYNGADMLWNPHYDWSTDYTATGAFVLGGKHNIYISGQTFQDTTGNLDYTDSKLVKISTAYDANTRNFALLKSADDENVDPVIRNDGLNALYNNVVYVGRPLLNRYHKDYDAEANPYGFIKSDVTIKIRMANPFRGGGSDNESNLLKPDSLMLNGNNPMFKFSTKGKGMLVQRQGVAESALDNINIVPNPYYAYDSYELKQTQKLVKVTNLPENCTVSIYNIGGGLVRKFEKSSPLSYLDWDLKNEYGIEIASGVYIIHVNVPGVGEKVLKWFGALRPIDLNNI